MLTVVGILTFMSRINFMSMCSRGSLSTLVQQDEPAFTVMGRVSDLGHGGLGSIPSWGIGDKHCFASYIW